MRKRYDSLYNENDRYWGESPSPLSLILLQHVKTKTTGAIGRTRLLDIGCGQGPDTLFFVRKGFNVTAMDISPIAIADLRKHAEELPKGQTAIIALEQDMRELPEETFDVIFSRMALQMIPATHRRDYIEELKTRYPDALHAHIIPITGACFGDDFICNDTLLTTAYTGWSIILQELVWTTSRVPNKKGEHYLMREAWILARKT